MIEVQPQDKDHLQNRNYSKHVPPNGIISENGEKGDMLGHERYSEKKWGLSSFFFLTIEGN